MRLQEGWDTGPLPTELSSEELHVGRVCVGLRPLFPLLNPAECRKQHSHSLLQPFSLVVGQPHVYLSRQAPHVSLPNAFQSA